MLHSLTIVAVMCYAVNGALKAMQKRMDFFGVLVIALVTAIGGGTVRDLLLRLPVFWISDPTFLYVGMGTAALVVMATRVIQVPSRAVVVTDALGLALFAVIGAHVARNTGVPRVPAILTGAMTGFGGGVVRDLLCGEMPRVLKRDVHATAAITGAATYVLLFAHTGNESVSLSSAIALVLLIRAIEVRSGFHLPTLRVASHSIARPKRDRHSNRETPGR